VSGRVVKVGSDYSDCQGGRFQVGDRVAVPFILSCGKCDYCHNNQSTVCSQQQQPGFTMFGSFAEYVAIPRASSNVCHLPATVSFIQAAAIGCRFTTAYRAVVQQGKCRTVHTICVFGVGGLGLSCIMIAAAMNIQTIIAVDIRQEALEKARQLGATHVVLAASNNNESNNQQQQSTSCSSSSVVQQVLQLTNGQGSPLTIEAAGFASSCENAIQCTRRGGRMIQVGLPIGNERELPKVPMGLVAGRELELIGSHGASSDTVKEVLDLVAERRLDPSLIVERLVSLEEGARVLQEMDRTSPLGITMITKFVKENDSRL
jgi:alcohol dehydrogenase